MEGRLRSRARAIVAVDPVEFKREQAQIFGATHVAESTAEALGLVAQLTRGRMADVAILTVGVLTGDLLGPELNLVSKAVGSSAPQSRRPARWT